MRRIVLFGMPLIAAMFVACGGEDPIEQAQPTMSAGSCVEQYSIETLKNRDYAFDGTIKSITPDPADGPDTVVFEVGTWFTGGSGADATKRAYGFGGGMTTSVGGAAHEVGDRLLVAGDEDFVWECGFTQPYDADVAADWDEALN
jgi:hypothetical protein